MRRARYKSALPDTEPLTPDQSADLLFELGRIKDAIFAGHIRLIRKRVHAFRKHYQDCNIDPLELEAEAIDALWKAIGKVGPRERGYFPLAYFRKYIDGALERLRKKTEQRGEREGTTFSDLGEDWEPVDHGSKAADVDAMRAKAEAAMPEVERKVPGFGELYTLRANRVGWAEISRRLGEPDSTLSSRFQRGVKILSKMVSEEST